MKVVAINGSPRVNGNTAAAFSVMKSVFDSHGIEIEIINVGSNVIRGCIGCESCVGKGKCVFNNDIVNAAIDKMRAADGIILGSPVYFSGVAGTMKSFLDRAFFVATREREFKGKVGAALVSARRSGGSAALDCLNHYIVYSEMTLVGSSYWPIIHGWGAGEAVKDTEGMDTVKMLAENMAWVLMQRDAMKDNLPYPDMEKRRKLNFIR